MRLVFKFRLVTTLFMIMSTFSIVRPVFADDDCQITLSQATVDLRAIRKEDAVKSSQGWNQMTEKEVNVSVFCPSTRKIAIYFTDHTSKDKHFKWGSESILTIKVSQLILDGQRYNIAKTASLGSFQPVGSGQDMQLINNQQGIIPVMGSTAIQGQQLNFTLSITPVLKDREFQVADRINLSNDISISVIEQ